MFKNNEKEKNLKFVLKIIKEEEPKTICKQSGKGIFSLPDVKTHHKAALLETLVYLCVNRKWHRLEIIDINS